MVVKDGYKKTEIGFIPDDWEVKKLGEILQSTQLGGNYPNTELETNSPLIKMGNLVRGYIDLSKLEYITNTHKPYNRDKLCYGDVIFNTRNTLDLVGKVAIWRNELPFAFFNSNIMRLKFKEKYVASNFYMNYIFNTKKILSQLRNIATGTTSVAAIYTRDLLTIQISLPPLSEQKAMVEVLSDTDNLIQALEKRIAKKRLIKQGAMQKLLTLKEDWEVKKLGEIAEYRNGKSYENHIAENGKYFLITLNSIDIKGKMKNNHLKINFYDGSLNKGDLIMILSDVAHGNFLGLTDVIPEDNKYVLNQRVGALKNIKFILPELLSMFINLNQKYFKMTGQGSSQQNLGKNDILDFEIHFPKSKKEQTHIATILSDMDTEIEALEKKLEKYKQLKQGLMQNLLTGKIRLI